MLLQHKNVMTSNVEAPWDSKIYYNNASYAVIPSDDIQWLSTYSLPTNTSDAMVGQLEGYATYHSASDEKTVPVYEYKQLNGNAIKIIQYDNQNAFIVYETNEEAVLNNTQVSLKDM